MSKSLLLPLLLMNVLSSIVVNGFTVQSPLLQRSISATSSVTSLAAQAGSKFYQLEEMEDQDTCTTEVFLSNDGSVTVSQTDGPIPSEASGTWEQSEDTFTMKIKRSFGAGLATKKSTAVGNFSFSVERLFTGTFTEVGGSFAISGSMLLLDEDKGEIPVGYFSMLDTTDAKLGDDE